MNQPIRSPSSSDDFWAFRIGNGENGGGKFSSERPNMMKIHVNPHLLRIVGKATLQQLTAHHHMCRRYSSNPSSELAPLCCPQHDLSSISVLCISRWFHSQIPNQAPLNSIELQHRVTRNDCTQKISTKKQCYPNVMHRNISSFRNLNIV